MTKCESLSFQDFVKTKLNFTFISPASVQQPPVTSSLRDRSILMRSERGEEIWLSSSVHKQYVSIKIKPLHEWRKPQKMKKVRNEKAWKKNEQEKIMWNKTKGFKVKRFYDEAAKETIMNEILMIKAVDHRCPFQLSCNKSKLLTSRLKVVPKTNKSTQTTRQFFYLN